MGRKCAVPHCYTGYRKCKEKASLFKAPIDDFFLTKWQEAIAREDRPITPKDHVCEKHFRDEDFIRQRIIHNVLEPYERPKLKPDAIPSIFPDLPEFILKMTKKRRKITVESNVNLVDITRKSGDDVILIENDPLNNSKDDTPEKTNQDNEVTILNNEEITIKSEVDEPMDVLVENVEDDPNGPKMHHCNECDYKTKYAHNLRTHKTKHLSGDDVYMTCEYCVNYKTKWESTYLNHMKNKHGINMLDTLKCTFCHFKTKVLICLTRHCDREHKGQEAIVDDKFKCEHVGCDYASNSNALMSIHSLEHKNDKTNEMSQTAKKAFSCTECHFETDSKRHIVIHTKSAHSSGDKSVAPMNSTKKSPVNVRTAKKSKAVHKFKCSRCPYRTHSQNSLEKHLEKHQFFQRGESMETMTTLKCPNCPYTSLSSHELEDHQRTTCIDKFFCKECPLSFIIKSDFIKHILTHRNTTIEAVKSNKTSSITKDEQNNQSSSKVQEFDTILIKEEHYSDEDHIDS